MRKVKTITISLPVNAKIKSSLKYQYTISIHYLRPIEQKYFLNSQPML